MSIFIAVVLKDIDFADMYIAVRTSRNNYNHFSEYE